MKRVLLDTNAYSLLLKGSKKTKEAVEKSPTVYMSTIVMGELLAAFKSGSALRKNINLLEKFLEEPTVSVLEVSVNTAEYYAQIYHDLKTKGKPIPINDVWIAANAQEAGAVLLTFDKHFLEIPGLRVWDGIKE